MAFFDYTRPKFSRQHVSGGGNATCIIPAFSSSSGLSYPFSWAIWSNADNDTGDQAIISLTTSGTANTCFYMYHAGSSGGATRTATQTTTVVSALASTSQTIGAWNLCVGVYVGSADRQASVNNSTFVQNTTSRSPTGMTQLNIGKRNTEGGSIFRGRLAWPAIWDIALTQDDVKALWLGTHPTKVQPNRLKAFWDVNGNSGWESLGPQPLAWTMVDSDPRPTPAPAHPKSLNFPVRSQNFDTLPSRRVWWPGIAFTEGAAPTFNAGWASGATSGVVGTGIS